MNKNRLIDPIVSTEWLSANLEKAGMLIVDIRSGPEYLGGHIPGAINIPFAAWSVARDGLQLEVPDPADLFRLFGSAGITPQKSVVIVNRTDGFFPLADANRAADTLIYAGCLNAAVLDGGQEKWARENRPLSCDPVSPEPAEYFSQVNEGIFVNRDYVQSRIGSSIILDARDPASYFGTLLEKTAARAGHIPTARNLPSPWVWTAEGTYQPLEVLKEMAAGVIGAPGKTEVIVYCGVGGYASTWWFVLTNLLGYENVKFFDGSAQDWTRDPQLPVVKYKWE